jgi:hypothetical protein
MPKEMSSAVTFLNQIDVTDPWYLFSLYAQHLLQASGIHTLPVPLAEIRATHGFQRHSAPLPHRGFRLENSIFVNSDDSEAVQRFTEAHEIMEGLFKAIRQENPSRFPQQKAANCWQDKERWCERGAAELLMPSELFFPLVRDVGVSLEAGRVLASRCRTSLTATIRRMIDSDVAPCVFLLLREGHKKHQTVPSQDGQLVLFGSPEDWDPPAELRVWRSWRAPQVTKFICNNESISRGTSVYRTLKTDSNGAITEGCDELDMEYIKGTYHTESMKVTIGGVDTVMALVHLD